MKKIITSEDGKKFEAYIKMVMIKKDNYNNKQLVGVAYAGTKIACRAIYASLYNSSYVEIYDEYTGIYETIYLNSSFTKIEETNGKVTHVFAMPRSAIESEYKNMMEINIKQGLDNIPSKIIMTKGDLSEEVGYFLADVFGLPKTKDWLMKYKDLLPNNKIEEIEIETTDIAGDLKEYKAVMINSLTEQEMLSYIELAIKQSILKTKEKNNIETRAKFEKNWTTEQYLKVNAEVLLAKINEYTKPLYDGKHFSKYIAETKRVAVPAQAKAVMAINAVLKKLKGVFLVGAMGTGKTQISLTTAYDRARKREKSGATDGYRVLIVAPANVLPKWSSSEIPNILGRTCEISAYDLANIENYRYSVNRERVRLWRKYNLATNVVTILNNTEDALQYVKLIKSGWRIPKGKIHFVLISTDRMKFSASGFVLGAKWNPHRFEWISPDTGKPLQAPKLKKEENDLETEVIARWDDVVEIPAIPPTKEMIDQARKEKKLTPQGLPIGYVKKWKENVRSFQNSYKGKTNRILARPALKRFGETHMRDRWMIAQIFQKSLPYHFHLGIFDEVHQTKARGSGRGLAFHKILKACRKSVFLTGTLTNGQSSSIQAVLWRAFPQELIEDGFNYNTSAEKWAERYGVLEEIRILNEDDTEVGVTTNRRKDKVILKEKAGISPELIAKYLLDKAVFLELSDLNVPLVELEEKPIIVELDDEHLHEYKKFHNSLYTLAQQLQKEIGSSVWSRFNPTTINYADQPSLDITIEFKDKDGVNLGRIKATKFQKEYLTAKERKLIEIVKERLKQNRGVMIYTRYTQGYKTNERLQWVLKQAGIEAKILGNHVSPEKRFEWIDEEVRKGTKVIITNQRLVEVGLDLLAFPTIIFYQLDDDINTVRQAAKRAHRLGQHRRCEVLYLVANETQQMAQFQRLMSRRVSALLVEGVIERSDELAKYADVSVAELTNDLGKMLAASEIAKAWEETAKRDIDKNIELVSEEELQERIVETFERLTEETKRLCGYKETEVDTVQTNNTENQLSVELAWAELEFVPEQKERDKKISLFDYAENTKTIAEKDREEKDLQKVEQLSMFDLL